MYVINIPKFMQQSSRAEAIRDRQFSKQRRHTHVTRQKQYMFEVVTTVV